MRYKIKDIPSEGRLVELALPRSLFAEALAGTEGDPDRATGSVRVELSKDRDDNVYARGRLTAQLVLACAGCLGPAPVSVDAPLQLTFVPESGDALPESEDPLEDADVARYDGQVVDLEPVLREQIILSLPMSPRCREDCAGLCPTCGQNRNEADCGHQMSESPSAIGQQLQKIRDRFPKG